MNKMRSQLRRVLGVVVFAATLTGLHAQTYTVLYSFGTNAGDPKSPSSNGLMTQGRDGNVYSTTNAGGTTGTGAAFKITTSGVLTKLADFTDTPIGGLNLGFDGNYYGTTSLGGTHNLGTVFKISSTGQLTTLWNFDGLSDGANPLFPPLQGQDGNFYGPSQGGYGLAYRMTPAGALTLLAAFNNTDGNNPNLPAQGTDGSFYGTARFGGISGFGCQIGCGVVYKLTTAGKITVLHSFAGYPNDGATPQEFWPRAATAVSMEPPTPGAPITSDLFSRSLQRVS